MPLVAAAMPLVMLVFAESFAQPRDAKVTEALMSRFTRKTTPLASQTEIVSPIWLAKALGLVLLVALLCTYLTLCLFFLQGQWQIVLHPIRSKTPPPANSPVVRFGPDESATPQLVGVWLPALPGARYGETVILFLPSGDGSRTDSDPTLEALHDLGFNVLAFDYRGYGFSANTHPNQERMTQDAESAWRYLTTTRGIPTNEIVPYGTGVGASLAAQLALRHREIPAVILESPHADLLEVAQHDPRTSIIPTRLLFHERFPLAEPLASLNIPKLLISRGTEPAVSFKTASEPKITVELKVIPGPVYSGAITRFADQYMQQRNEKMPNVAPSTTNSH